jgi:hypothetical protein
MLGDCYQTNGRLSMINNRQIRWVHHADEAGEKRAHGWTIRSFLAGKSQGFEQKQAGIRRRNNETDKKAERSEARRVALLAAKAKVRDQSKLVKEAIEAEYKYLSSLHWSNSSNTEFNRLDRVE